MRRGLRRPPAGAGTAAAPVAAERGDPRTRRVPAGSRPPGNGRLSVHRVRAALLAVPLRGAVSGTAAPDASPGHAGAAGRSARLAPNSGRARRSGPARARLVTRLRPRPGTMLSPPAPPLSPGPIPV